MIKNLSIENKFKFELIELLNWEEYQISSAQIITVISWEIFDKIKWRLKTFESSVYYSWIIKAEEKTPISIISLYDELTCLNKIDVEKEYWEYCRRKWSSLLDLTWLEEHRNIDLYRSEQYLNDFDWESYRFNLWFCWKEVDCLFHNEHDFIEIHTCIAGDWYMQKSTDWTKKWLIETVWLLPWNSHRKFNIEREFELNWNPKYPYHRWLWWTTWNIWLVIEKI